MVEIKFEAALAKLERIVEDLESGKLTLEGSIAKYEEGMKLSKVCSQKLEAAREKIEILVKSDKGKLKTKSFSAKEELTSKKETKKRKEAKEESEEELLF